MADEITTVEITYDYGIHAPLADLLFHRLKDEGVQVHWTKPLLGQHQSAEQLLLTDINDTVVQMIATGSAITIGHTIKMFRQRIREMHEKGPGGPRRDPVEKLVVRGSDGEELEPDDGGFLTK